MRWQRHSKIIGQHAFLGASKHSWLNYDEEKLAASYFNHLAVKRGTELHEVAAKLIENKIQLPPDGSTLSMYVNDAIHFGLKPEQVLYFSDNCFGTADAIQYSAEESFLRIHDLKTGQTPASIDQLLIYAALFFLEYDISIGDTDVELRIYQNDDILISNPTIEEIAPVVDKIIIFDKIIEEIKRSNAE